MKRTHTCGALRATDASNQVTLQGWVNRRRDLGGLIFFDIRDYSGMTQIVVPPDSEAFELAEALRSEYVVEVQGQVRQRPEDQRSDKTPSGDIEVLASNVTILSKAKTPPFLVDGSVDASQVSEELRLKYRYLDLRRPRLADPGLYQH